MKTLMSFMLAAMFSVAMLPAQAAQATPGTPIVSKTLSMGDGVDNRQCNVMKKRGMKLPGFCRP